MRKAITLVALSAGLARAQAWDDAAAKDLETFARATFQAWQAQDLAAIRASMASEGGLGAYDTDMNGSPVTIRSLDEQERYAKQMFEEMGKMGASASYEIRSIACRATSTAGVCAIEFDASMAMPVGGKQTWAIRATMIGRRGADGWKATHWHASPAQAPAQAQPESMDMGPTPIPMLLADAKTATWQEIPGTGGVKTAQLWENPETRAAVSMVQFPKKWKIAKHYHSAGMHALVIKGQIKTTASDGTVADGKPGTWAYDPAKWIHSTESKRGATVLMMTDGPFDVVMVDDQGNPLPPPAAPAAAPAK
jgi:quercetin dioxygenase-like cupin family protein